MQTSGWNSMAYGMTLGNAKMPAEPTAEKSSMPKGADTMMPAIMPKKTLPSLRVPLAKLLRPKTTANVTSATHHACGVPQSAVPSPPAMYLMAVG